MFDFINGLFEFFFISMGGLIIVSVFSALMDYIRSLLQSSRKKRDVETVEKRIVRLTKALSDSARLVSEIENEVKQRESLATKLKEDVDTYNELIKLRKPEVEAVAQVLRGEIQQEGRRSFWQQLAINFFFFLLGVGTTLLIGR